MGIIYYKGIGYGLNNYKLSRSCLSGDTNVIFQDKNIKTTSYIDYNVSLNDGKLVSVSNVIVINGQVTLTFATSLTSNATAKILIRNI